MLCCAWPSLALEGLFVFVIVFARDISGIIVS